MVKNPNTATSQRKANPFYDDLNFESERAKDSKSVKQVSNRLARRKAKLNLKKEANHG